MLATDTDEPVDYVMPVKACPRRRWRRSRPTVTVPGPAISLRCLPSTAAAVPGCQNLQAPPAKPRWSLLRDAVQCPDRFESGPEQYLVSVLPAAFVEHERIDKYRKAFRYAQSKA